MNYGILHNRRRDPKAAGTGVQALLADPRMRGLAQHMGLRPSDFGAEAQQLWNQLDAMATSDPKRYQEFIQEQLQDGPPSNQATHDATHDATRADTPPAVAPTVAPTVAQKPATPRFFTPRAGFVIKSTALYSVKCQRKEIKLFLNVCAHEIVGRPVNPNNHEPVPEDSRAVPSTSNLQIPLLVGKPRELRDASGGGLSLAVDVVVHDWVLQRCAWDASFKREVLKLALQWVQEDAKVALATPTGKFIKSRYKGGVAVGTDIITSKFYLDASGQASGPASSRPTETRAIGTPSELLRRMETISEDEEQLEEKIVVTAPPPAPIGRKKPKEGGSSAKDAAPASSVTLDLSKATKASGGKVLIEEIHTQADSPSSETLATRSDVAPPAPAIESNREKSVETKSRVIKRGFLNSSKKTLYPNGSSEGRKASAYVNLLHRSKVVDLRDADAQTRTQEQQQQQQQQQQRQDEIRSILGEHESSRQSAVPAADEIDHGDFEFEQLCMEADPDLKPTGPREPSREDNAAPLEVFGEGFGDLARLLAS